MEAKYGLVGRLANIRAEIFHMYIQSNPRKIADIDELMEQWNGEEEHLLANISAKYRRQYDDAFAAIRRRMTGLFDEHDQVIAQQRVKHRNIEWSPHFHALFWCLYLYVHCDRLYQERIPDVRKSYFGQRERWRNLVSDIICICDRRLIHCWHSGRGKRAS